MENTTTLSALEAIIERGERTALQSVEALKQIRDLRLYKPSFTTFDCYLAARWRFSRQHAARLIAAAECAGRLSPIGDNDLKESHLRPLAKIPEDRQQKAVEKFQKLPPKQRTAKAMEKIVREIKLQPVHGTPVVVSEKTETSGYNTPLGWYGGKFRLRQEIIELMPQHDTYVEPFFGGGSVLFSKPPSKVEIVSDINHGVVNFFSILRDKGNMIELQRRLKLTPYSREEHRKCCDPKPTGDSIEDARRFFVRVRQSYSSIEGDTWSLCVKGGGGNPRSSDNANVVDRLHEVAERLRKVQIESRDFTELLPKCDIPNSLVYCDPTYPHETRAGNGNGYLHEMEDADHLQLLDILNSFKNAKVILSGYQCPMYNRSLKNWTPHEFGVTVHASGARGSVKAKRTECLWKNF